MVYDVRVFVREWPVSFVDGEVYYIVRPHRRFVRKDDGEAETREEEVEQEEEYNSPILCRKN